jgi:hypothetical protein
MEAAEYPTSQIGLESITMQEISDNPPSGELGDESIYNMTLILPAFLICYPYKFK